MAKRGLFSKILTAAAVLAGTTAVVADASPATAAPSTTLRMIKDIASGPSYSSHPGIAEEFEGSILFSAGPNDAELWRSDGTEAGTTLVKDILPGTGYENSSSPGELTRFGSSVLFSARDASHGRELWSTDGTAAGTVLLKDIHPSPPSGQNFDPPSSHPTGLTVFGPKVLFWADDGVAGYEPWVTDGTAEGTTLLADINPDGHATTAYLGQRFTLLNEGLAAFWAHSSTLGSEVWVTDGTPAGTRPIGDINSGESLWSLGTVGGNKLVFSYNGGAFDREVWISDGTSAGTHLLKDVQPGPYPSDPAGFTAFGQRTVFTANDGTHGTEVWITDGTPGGTTMLKDVNKSGGSHPRRLFVAGSRLYFMADDGVHGDEMWVTDGTTAGTKLLKDIHPTGDGVVGWSEVMGVFGTSLVFRADDGEHGEEVWITDGTTRGTSMLSDIRPGPDGSDAKFFRRFGASVVFSANDGEHGDEPWLLSPLMRTGPCASPTITGTDRGETIQGTPGPDVIDGFGGNDTINGGGGDDLICGGSGDDHVIGGQGDDALFGEDGDDRLNGGTGRNECDGGSGSNRLTNCSKRVRL